jgi:integrase
VVTLWRAARAEGASDLADVIRIAAFTGARIESICQITVGDMGTDESSGIEFIALSDKTDAGKRLVPIHPALKPMLGRLTRAAQGGYLIPSTARNQYNERSAPLSKRFGRLRTKLHFDQAYVFHSIRKTVATRFEQTECPEGVAAEVLGHKKPTMTYGMYSGGSAIDRKIYWMEKALIYPDEEFMMAA